MKPTNEHEQMRRVLDGINSIRQTAAEEKTAEKLWRKPDIRAAVLVADAFLAEIRPQTVRLSFLPSSLVNLNTHPIP